MAYAIIAGTIADTGYLLHRLIFSGQSTEAIHSQESNALQNPSPNYVPQFAAFQQTAFKGSFT